MEENLLGSIGKVARMIHFNLKTDEYGWLSNFAPFPVVNDDLEWASNEHYYQASKFIEDRFWTEAIRTVPRPYDAWRMGRSPDHRYRADWIHVKDEVMLRAVRAKFTQHENLRQLLLATGDEVLVEHSRDAYRGDGGD